MNMTVIGCWGGYPKVNEASSGYLFEEDGFKLLIDCGSGVLSHLQNHIQPEQLDAVLLSHYHPDHVADIGVLQHALLISKHLGKEVSPLPIYGHQEDEAGFAALTYKDLTIGKAYHPDEKLIIGPFTVEFLRTVHPVPCYAVKISNHRQSVVYTADSAYQEAFIPFIKGSSLLLCESNFYSGMDGQAAGHMTSSEAGKLARQAGVNTLVLTHLPHFGELTQLKAEAEAEFEGTVLLAKEDLEIGL
ncbi:MBL fold metallo-hydrolase [Pseudobacillus badius]|uniref:MBL fold metallo-hydrolase n=1 Tax=Bacillus badius TaxID=1455 RepID=UPI0024A5A00B|nr:MBL fold metallo-hydrolase [Bacillus badius]GLY11270.1 putative metallo-hydrolase YhfI [Bacillus badius]